MRNLLSDLLVQTAQKDSRCIVLSGDHGYALFDAIRQKCPNQFLNVGVMEQAMIGIAAGLARAGFRPIVYGLSAFVPIRVLEQIKLDLCYSSLPVMMLGDGAGLVYSTLGSSHHCAEDIACLRPLPSLRIYAPADALELDKAFAEAWSYAGPSYLRIGKSDRPVLSNDPKKIASVKQKNEIGLLSMGSMTQIAANLSAEFGLVHKSIWQIKPFSSEVLNEIRELKHLIILEEHSRWGGLTTALVESWLEADLPQQGFPLPRISPLTLQEKFADRCGSWQYALSEHNMSDRQIRERVISLIS